ncbi:tripartite motif-containing protein 65 isoform X1 [Dicentrarchus labrax]|uniref:tripartite motif-containing protein 65 isoform X1 n=1 Tax=Dicentrarchus labrax TaxID=13489 RepID=UPI0021F555D8|nr:tripartite motif-containing protein 65 isoform X1 [Dicentrarchus labrax]XP_051274414.1 tripartite motif-containing protein 65 isoform X1 [Dicentrarchus labrax]
MDSQNSNLTCIICLDRFKVPVTLPCGHSFCQACITKFWDSNIKPDIGPHCPICNQRFPTRPILKRNVSMSLLTEATNSTAPSLRESHMRGGEGARAMLLCERHKKPLVYYCKQDRMSVCCECGISECVNHEKVLLEAERENQELLLERKSKEVGKLMEETEKSIKDLAENISQAKVTLQQTSTWVKVKFSTLMKILAEKQEVTELFIEEQQESAISEAEARLAELQERSRILQESQGQIAAVHNLSDTDLIKESMVIEVPRFKDIPTDVTPNLQDRLNGVTDVLSRVSKLVAEDLEKAVSTAVGQDKDACHWSPGSPQDKRPILAVVPSPAAPCHPGGKEGLSAYRCSLTFDPRTANMHLFLSQENRRAEHLASGPRPVPSHEARFDHTWQVLCFQGFKHGQHYWELEVSKPWAYLGVTYETIPRKEKGKKCMVGMNDLSWSLQLDEHQLSAWHNGRRETLAGHSQHSRIGMLLDYEAGTLTYYGDGQTRLHAFHCAFTQELFPACWIGEGVSITLCST